MRKRIGKKASVVLMLFILFFALISVFGLSLITGNQDQTNIGSSNASSTEPADINNDNKVDVFDLSILLSKWGTNNTTSDLNKDGTTNVFDLSMLLSKWGVVSTVNTFDVKTYGAVGDDSADDTSKIQATINAAAAVKGTVIVSTGTYKITSQLNVPAGITISGTGEIHQISPNMRGLNITGSDVTVEGITLRGRHSTPTYAGGEYGIYSSGSATMPFSDITIRDVSISKWGAYGTYMRFINNLNVTGCNVFDIGYLGIGALTVAGGLIENNRVDNITGYSGADKYGIAVTFSGNDPDSTDVMVRGNVVSRVSWEALDTHGGKRISFINNTVLSSGAGIALNGLRTSAGYARVPKDIIVMGNLIDGEVDDRVVGAYGVQLVGLAEDRATATITNNTFRRCAETYFKNTDGVDISNNTFDRLNRVGVALIENNSNFSIMNNTIIDVWSEGSFTAGIQTYAYSGGNNGIIEGNRLQASGLKTARYLNQYGYYYSAGITDIILQNNDFNAATVAPIAGVK